MFLELSHFRIKFGVLEGKQEVCQTWRKIYPVHLFPSAPLFETHRAKKMSTAHVNSEYPDQSVRRTDKSEPAHFTRGHLSRKILAGMKLCSLYIFTFLQSFTFARKTAYI